MRVYTYEQLLAIGDRYFPLSEALRAVVERCDIRRAVLERTANAFRVGVPQGEQEQRLKAVQGLLNKLTPEKYGDLAPQVLEQGRVGDLDPLVALLVEKACREPKLNELYAQLCADLQADLERHSREDAAAFARLLAIRCSQESSKSFVDAADLPDVEDERHKKRVVGCGKFIGELFNHRLASEAFVAQHLQRLLRCSDPGAVPTAAELQGAIGLLEACGGALEPDPAGQPSHALSAALARVKELSQSHPQPRLRFLLMDMLDLRGRRWVPRHPKPKLQKLSEGENLKQVPAPATNPDVQLQRAAHPRPDSLASRFAPPASGHPHAGLKRKEPEPGGEPGHPPAKVPRPPAKAMSFEEKCAIWAAIDQRKEEQRRRAEEQQKAQQEAYRQSKPHLRDGAVWERGVLAPGAQHDSGAGPLGLEWLHEVSDADLQRLYTESGAEWAENGAPPPYDFPTTPYEGGGPPPGPPADPRDFGGRHPTPGTVSCYALLDDDDDGGWGSGPPPAPAWPTPSRGPPGGIGYGGAPAAFPAPPPPGYRPGYSHGYGPPPTHYGPGAKGGGKGCPPYGADPYHDPYHCPPPPPAPYHMRGPYGGPPPGPPPPFAPPYGKGAGWDPMGKGKGKGKGWPPQHAPYPGW
eukprot:EG_transcript_5327